VCCPNPVCTQHRGISCSFKHVFLDPWWEEELCVGSAGIILLTAEIAEIAQQGSLMERWSLKCQNNTVSLCIPPGGGEVSEQPADNEGSRRCGRMLLLLFQISSALPPLYPSRQWHAETLPCLFSQQLFPACCLAVFQNGRYCPIHPELSLGKKSECFIVETQD